MPQIKGVFTDKGREWFSRIMARQITASDGINFFRIGEGGYRVLPTLAKVPVDPRERITRNGLVAARGVKGDLTIDPDTAAPGDIISVSISEVPDANTGLFFVQKDLIPADLVWTQPSASLSRLEISCTLLPPEANKTFNSQGGLSPKLVEIGVFAVEGTDLFMVGYGTFAEQVKLVGQTMTNKVILDLRRPV